jgi:hypothetical protein
MDSDHRIKQEEIEPNEATILYLTDAPVLKIDIEDDTHNLLNCDSTLESEVTSIQRSDPISIPKLRTDLYPVPLAVTPPVWRGRLSSTWPTAPCSTLEAPLAPISDTIDPFRTPLKIQLQNKTKESFSMPSIVSRIVFALNFLSSTRFEVDLTFLPSNLFNRWKITLRKLARKYHANPTSLTVLENRLLRQHAGFQYLDIMWATNRFLLARRTWKKGSELEMAAVAKEGHYMPNYCLTCQVLHNGSSSLCPSLLANGPRLLEYITLDPNSYKQVKAVCVGHSALFHQPSDLRSDMLNLSSNIVRPYYVPANGEDINTEPTLPASLGMYLSKIISLFEANSTIPIFVEFYKSPLRPGAHINMHLMGFLKVIQALHKGPIIMVVPPVMPLNVRPGKTYWEEKHDHLYVGCAAHVLGSALGVPVGLTFIQDLGGVKDGLSVWETHWSLEPILNESGGPTREYFKRLSFWFRMVMKFISEDQERTDESVQSDTEAYAKRMNQRR